MNRTGRRPGTPDTRDAILAVARRRWQAGRGDEQPFFGAEATGWSATAPHDERQEEVVDDRYVPFLGRQAPFVSTEAEIARIAAALDAAAAGSLAGVDGPAQGDRG